MKKVLFLLFVTVFWLHPARSQNLVGMSSVAIVSYLEKSKGINPDSLQKGTNSDGKSYISFENTEKKTIYFLDSAGNCYCYRIIYPYNMLNAILAKLDKQFTQQGRFQWFVSGNKNFLITLEPNDDFFVTDTTLE